MYKLLLCLISVGIHYIEGEWLVIVVLYILLEPSLSLTNLTTLLENVNVGDNGRWWGIGNCFNIPDSKLNAIEGQHSSPDQRSRACWDLYVSEHPSPSWKGVAYALYETDHLEELEVVHKKYLKGE